MSVARAAAPVAWLPIGAMAALYLGCGRRLAWGYVDLAPVTAVLAHVSETLFGPSVEALRLVAAIAGGVVVALGGLVARELGGDRRTQLVACALVVATPVLFGASTLFQTVVFGSRPAIPRS